MLKWSIVGSSMELSLYPDLNLVIGLVFCSLCLIFASWLLSRLLSGHRRPLPLRVWRHLTSRLKCSRLNQRPHFDVFSFVFPFCVVRQLGLWLEKVPTPTRHLIGWTAFGRREWPGGDGRREEGGGGALCSKRWQTECNRREGGTEESDSASPTPAGGSTSGCYCSLDCLLSDFLTRLTL